MSLHILRKMVKGHVAESHSRSNIRAC